MSGEISDGGQGIPGKKSEIGFSANNVKDVFGGKDARRDGGLAGVAQGPDQVGVAVDSAGKND